MVSLATLWKKGTDFLGTPYAILGGAMTWVSERHLVSAISNGGGFGVLASGSMPPEALREEIRATRSLTSKPFGVNLITMHPCLEELIKVCIEEMVTHVALAGGLPTGESIALLKRAGIKVLCFAPALVIAKRLLRLGVDALIIEGMEAGGHVGPVSTTVLAQEILPVIQEVPVFVAGGIARGEAMVSYLKMGAAGCQLGSRFVCSTECRAHPKFKALFIRSNARDAVLSPQIDFRFPIIPVRGIENEGMKKFVEVQRTVIARFERGEITQQEGALEIEHFWAGALRRAVVEGDIETGSVMAGQSVGLIKEELPAAAILQQLVEQANTILS